MRSLWVARAQLLPPTKVSDHWGLNGPVRGFGTGLQKASQHVRDSGPFSLALVHNRLLMIFQTSPPWKVKTWKYLFSHTETQTVISPQQSYQPAYRWFGRTSQESSQNQGAWQQCKDSLTCNTVPLLILLSFFNIQTQPFCTKIFRQFQQLVPNNIKIQDGVFNWV